MPNVNTSDQLKRSDKSTIKLLRERYDLSEKEAEKLNKYERDLDKKAVESKYFLMRKAEEEAHKKRLEDYKKEGNVIGEMWEKNFGTLSQATSTLVNAVDQSLNKYLDAQQKLSAHLSGSTTSLTSVLDRMQSTLSTTNLVRQEKVFDNLGSLVRSGITYNVEQRAFLQTLAQDIDMVFNAQNGSLTQLIRLQNNDLSSNRMAIEYSLQKFLNQNYQTSEYIKDAFNSVSNSLLTAQSTMSSRNAVDFEGTVQTWLGSMYSAGMNKTTVESLASALNALGSGDISNLGSGISNLVLMGAARAGLDYGALLNNGLDANTTDKLLASITSYMQEMGANQSNVVRSQLGNLFGVNITDLISANNMRSSSGSVTSDISDLFNDYNEFVTFGTGLKNTLENLKWSFGTNVASDRTQLMAYEISKIISKSGLGDLLYGMGDSMSGGSGALGLLGGAAGSVLKLAGVAATNAPLIPILTSFFGINGSGLGNGTLADILSSAGNSGSAESLFKALGSGALSGGNVKFSGAGVSGSMYMSNSGVTDLLSGSQNSLADLASNVVTIEADEGPTLEENVTTITDTVSAILDVLTERLESIDNSILNIASNSSSVGWSSVIGGASF